MPIKFAEIEPLSPDKIKEFWSMVDRSSGPLACWEWGGARNARGYGRFRPAPGAERRLAPRIAFLISIGPPGQLMVCHRCDNPPCCNPAHLFLGTNRDNVEDMVQKGRHSRGSRNAQAILSEARVAQMLAAHDILGLRSCDVAVMFGVARKTASHVLRGSRWAHVDGQRQRAKDGRVRISDATVLQMRAAKYQLGMSDMDIARLFGILPGTTWKLVTGFKRAKLGGLPQGDA